MHSSGETGGSPESDSGSLDSRRVSIVGVGAIGTASAMLLAGAGLGSLKVIDRDFVESGNLRDQALYSEKDVGMPKAVAAKARLEGLAAKTKITAEVRDLDYGNVGVLEGSDVVLDCTDNFETRFLINDFCRKRGIPWIYAAALRKAGTAYCITPDAPCFRCIFDNRSGPETCDTAGVDGEIVAQIALMQAGQAIRILLGKPHEKLLVRIGPSGILKLKVRKNGSCKACKGNYEYLKAGSSGIVKLCGTNSYQIKGRPVDLDALKGKLENSRNFGYCLHSEMITVFRDGRAFVKADSPEKAKEAYDRALGLDQLSSL